MRKDKRETKKEKREKETSEKREKEKERTREQEKKKKREKKRKGEKEKNIFLNHKTKKNHQTNCHIMVQKRNGTRQTLSSLEENGRQGCRAHDE